MDNALGCIVGALVGDAAGAPLEFKKHITQADIDNAVFMKGGGPLNVGKGQITDDGELTVTLAASLCTSQYYPLETVASGYNNWYNSMPFDCGNTCGRAFRVQRDYNGSISDIMQYNAAKYNMLSEANGALMRLTPIPIKFYKESHDVLSQMSRIDATLSHPNTICQDCNSIYSIALANLVTNNGNTTKVYDIVNDYVRTHIHSPVKTWYDTERYKYKQDEDIAKTNIGHVKHAFCMAMNYLEFPESYETGIRRVLEMAGDSDTNAAICGGILGAINGFHKIPDHMKIPVLNYVYEQNNLIGYKRPDIYHASNVIAFVKAAQY